PCAGTADPPRARTRVAVLLRSPRRSTAAPRRNRRRGRTPGRTTGRSRIATSLRAWPTILLDSPPEAQLMARGPKPKTYQQRQTEKRQREEQDRALVEDTVSRFSCSNQIATDFAHQCEVRIDDLDFDIIISELAERFWAERPDSEQPVVAILREIDAERRRHRDALLQLREQLLPLTG